MADYDDIEIALTFSYSEWGLIADCLQKKRLDAHDRADRLDRENNPKVLEQIKGLRHRATDIFDLQEEIQEARADARLQSARGAA